jgi:hypothetical protein
LTPSSMNAKARTEATICAYCKWLTFRRTKPRQSNRCSRCRRHALTAVVIDSRGDTAAVAFDALRLTGITQPGAPTLVALTLVSFARTAAGRGFLVPESDALLLDPNERLRPFAIRRKEFRRQEHRRGSCKHGWRADRKKLSGLIRPLLMSRRLNGRAFAA